MKTYYKLIFTKQCCKSDFKNKPSVINNKEKFDKTILPPVLTYLYIYIYF